jgi:glycosyltransferase involved in cell wall biosynthesis
MTNMKILHVIAALGARTGGAAIACLELCAALAERGHHVEIFTTTMDIPDGWQVKVGQRFDCRGVAIHFLPAIGPKGYWFSPAMAKLLWQRVRDFDVVQVHSLYRFHLPVTAWICRYFKKPYVVKPHGSLDPYLFRHHRSRKVLHEYFLDRPAYAHASGIHYVADEERVLAESTDFIKRLSTKPVPIIVAEGTDSTPQFEAAEIKAATDALLSRFPDLHGKVIVLFLGRLNFKKGIDILIEAFASVRKAIPNAHLLFVGPDRDGYASQINIWLTQHQVSDATTFTGMLTGSEKAAAFRMASVFVLSSYTENFGIAIVEALVEGCPVVISNKVNIWREIEHSESGIVTDCDASQTAAAILRILGDSALARKFVANGQKLAQENYNWPAIAGQMESAYARLLHPAESDAKAFA